MSRRKGRPRRGVADGVTHFTDKSVVATFLDMKEPFNKV